MNQPLINCPLFTGMTGEEITSCLQASNSTIAAYEKDEMIFFQTDLPAHLLILMDGAVAICSDTASGKRNLVAMFDQRGELFGEVFVFLKHKEYGHYAQAVTQARVLRIPKEYFFQSCGKDCEYQSRLISNMLTILAQKAYFLNQKVQILSGSSLRQKIAGVLLRNTGADGKVTLSMNREELADFLNTARPSLSRELMNMQREGLIQIQKRDIYIVDADGLQNL